MEVIRKRNKQVLFVQKQFECSHWEVQVLADVYHRILPELQAVVRLCDQGGSNPDKAGPAQNESWPVYSTRVQSA